jgi:hypothetical protein
VVSAADPPRSLISVFLTGAATFISSSSSFILTRAEWTPFQTHCYYENLAAPGIEPSLQPGSLTTRPQRRSHKSTIQSLMSSIAIKLISVGSQTYQQMLFSLRSIWEPEYLSPSRDRLGVDGRGSNPSRDRRFIYTTQPPSPVLGPSSLVVDGYRG